MIDGKTIACAGGTFNRLHAGHRALLGTAAAVADMVRVGVTSDAFVKRVRGPSARLVRPYAQRAGDVRALLESIAPGRFEVVPLEDALTPVERPEFDAIVISPDTERIALTINELRASRRLGLNGSSKTL